MSRRTRNLLYAAAVLGAVFVLALTGLWLVWDEPIPEGRRGPEAEALAQAMKEAVGAQAWDREVGAIAWTLAGARHHLWDKRRGLARVSFDEHVVWLRLSDQTGVVHSDGNPVSGPEADALLERAWAIWCNDSFWLNPVVKVDDPGTTRSLVELDGDRRGLLVRYASGGVTPGDAYLWIVGPDDLPVAWRMWVSAIPIGGVEVGWAGYQELVGGARVATLHESALFTLRITEVRSASDAAGLNGGRDPFAALAQPRLQPTSQPSAAE